MREGKLPEDARARPSEMHDYLPPVVRSAAARYVAVIFQAIHQFHHAVMFELQSPGQLAYGGLHVFGQAFDGEQQLMLLRLQAVPPGLLLAEMQVEPDLVTELGQRAILGQS